MQRCRRLPFALPSAARVVVLNLTVAGQGSKNVSSADTKKLRQQELYVPLTIALAPILGKTSTDATVTPIFLAVKQLQRQTERGRYTLIVQL